MQQIVLIVIFTAVTTSVAMLTVGYLVYVKKLKPDLEARLGKVGDEVEERVRAGVLSAGQELLPEFRDKVTEGFTRALAEWPASEVTRMARTGANLVEDGLNSLFRKK